MAGDWIKMRVDLADDPAVIKIAGLLNVQEDLVVGKLHRLWAWAFTQTCDGTAAVSPQWIDRKVSLEGFAHAMATAGWLRIDAESVQFPHFERHLSNSAKQRALDAQRKATTRSSPIQAVRNVSGLQPDRNGTREEKRREEEEKQQQISRNSGNAREGMPSPRITPPGPAAAGAALGETAERPDVLQALDAVPIGEPKRSELAANPLLTVAMIRHVAGSGKGRGKRSGAIVLDIEAALRREAARALSRERETATRASSPDGAISTLTGAAAVYVAQPVEGVSAEDRRRIFDTVRGKVQRRPSPAPVRHAQQVATEVEPTAEQLAEGKRKLEALRHLAGSVKESA